MPIFYGFASPVADVFWGILARFYASTAHGIWGVLEAVSNQVGRCSRAG